MPARPRRARTNRILLALAAAWMAIALAIGSAAAESPAPGSTESAVASSGP